MFPCQSPRPRRLGAERPDESPCHPSVAGHGCDLGLRSGWRVGAPPGAPASDHHPGPCRACGGPLPSLRPPPPSGHENQRCPELPAAAGEGTVVAGEDEKGVCSAPSRLPSPAAPSAPPGCARTPAGGSRGVRTLLALPRRPPQPPRAHCLAGSPETVVVPRDTGRPGSRSRSLWPQAGLSPGARPPRQLGTASPTREVAGGRGPSLPAAPSP